MTDDFAGLDIAGLDNGGPDIDGLDIAGLQGIDGRLWAIDYNILTHKTSEMHTCIQCNNMNM